jgi:hypothetical protein
MKKGLMIAILLVIAGVILFNAQSVQAQCAQCAAAVKSNSDNGSVTANGLNNGIMYLLAAPYLAVGIVGFVWYKKYRRKNVNLNIRNEKLHLN